MLHWKIQYYIGLAQFVHGMYDSMFVLCWPCLPSCRAEHLIVQIITLIRNVTMACLFCTEIRRDSRLFSHFVSLHAWWYCSTFLSSDVILTSCCLHVFHVWYVSIIQIFGQECKLYVDGSMFWIEPTTTKFHTLIMILVLDAQHFASNPFHIISHRLPKWKFEEEASTRSVQSVALLNSRWHIYA